MNGTEIMSILFCLVDTTSPSPPGSYPLDRIIEWDSLIIPLKRLFVFNFCDSQTRGTLVTPFGGPDYKSSGSMSRIVITTRSLLVEVKQHVHFV